MRTQPSMSSLSSSGRRPGGSVPRSLHLLAILGVVIAPSLRAQPASTSDLSPVAAPPDPALLAPVERVPRNQFGVVGAFPLTADDLSSLLYPSATADERRAVMEGLTFFTTPHTAAEGLGPIANQPFCLGCHMNSAEAVREPGRRQLVSSVSQVSRAARATPTNFDFVGFDPATGGGRPADHLDALTVATCKHPGLGSQTSADRAHADCNWRIRIGARSLQLNPD